MDDNMYLPPNIDLLSSSTLLSMLREYQRSHVILGFSKTDMGASIRQKLGDAMKAIEIELGSRGYTHVGLVTRVN